MVLGNTSLTDRSGNLTHLSGVCGAKALDVHVVLVDRGHVEDGEGNGEVQIDQPKQLSTALPIDAVRGHKSVHSWLTATHDQQDKTITLIIQTHYNKSRHDQQDKTATLIIRRHIITSLDMTSKTRALH